MFQAYDDRKCLLSFARGGKGHVGDLIKQEEYDLLSDIDLLNSKSCSGFDSIDQAMSFFASFDLATLRNSKFFVVPSELFPFSRFLALLDIAYSQFPKYEVDSFLQRSTFERPVVAVKKYKARRVENGNPRIIALTPGN